MLIKQLLENDDNENYISLVKRIADSKYFNEMYGKQLTTIEPEDLENESLVNEFSNMYRGSKNYKTPYLVITPYGDRKPTDTNKEIHKYVNMLANEKFGVPVRNLIFGDRSIVLASEYGNPYVLFPLGEYQLFYSKGVKDFTARYSTDADIIYFIINEVLLEFEDQYDDIIMEKLSYTYDAYEFDFKNQKTFDKSLKKLARKMAAEYFNNLKSEVRQSEIKILEKKFYESGKKIFKQFSNYVDLIEVTESIHDIGNEEIMIHCDEIAAIHYEGFNKFLKTIMEMKDSLKEDTHYSEIKVKEIGLGYRIYFLSNSEYNYDNESYPHGNILQKENAIGYIDLENTIGKNYLLVSQSYIVKEARGYGVSKELYNSALDLAKSKGYRGIASDPEDRNIISDKFWKKYSQGRINGNNIITKPI